jgi:membrane-bound inhibitor of C-type lysozyme
MSDITRTGLALALLLAGTSAQAADADKIGPVTFTCDDGSAIEATFDNAPNPATVLLVRNGQQFTLPQAMSASGARYVGDDIEFWNKGRDAAVEWQGTKLECSTAE